jgi:uncharacterized protein YbjT (DUF2867 family)
MIRDEGVIKLPFGQRRHAPIAAEDQSRLIASILLNPEPHVGKSYELYGPVEMDYTGIAAAVGEVLDRTSRISRSNGRSFASGCKRMLCRSF